MKADPENTRYQKRRRNHYGAAARGPSPPGISCESVSAGPDINVKKSKEKKKS